MTFKIDCLYTLINSNSIIRIVSIEDDVVSGLTYASNGDVYKWALHVTTIKDYSLKYMCSKQEYPEYFI